MSRCKGNQNTIILAFVILVFYLAPVDANQHVSHVLQKLNSFRRRVVVDVQSALMDQHKTLYQHSMGDSGDRMGIDCEMKVTRLQKESKKEAQMIQKLLDETNGNLEMALQQLRNHQQNTEAETAAKVQAESDQWRAKYSRLLKEQSVKAASLEHVKRENAELKQEMQELRLKLQEIEKESFHESDVDAVKNKALENAWIGRQNAESELTVLKSKQHALMKELDSFRGNASMTDSAKDKALENAWTVLQETMEELAAMHRLADTLRQEKETQKVELHRSVENEINKWRRDYSKLLQYQSTIMTELHQVQSDNNFLREEMEKSVGQSEAVDAIKSKALENAWVGRQDIQKELIFANQLIDAMRKQVEHLQNLADQREREVGQIANAASSLAKLQKDFEAETSSKQAALVEQNKELQKNVRKLRTMLEEKTMEHKASVKSRVLEAEDKWWKQLSSARNHRNKSILSTKNNEIEKLNRDVGILSSDVVKLRVENERLVARLDEQHSEIILLSSGTESFARAHEDFKISAEKQIEYLTHRVTDTQALLNRKEEKLAWFQDRLNTSSKECDALLREQTKKSNEDCREALFDRENRSRNQIAAASNATMAAIDAVQQDLLHAYEQLYRVTEQNKHMEAKLVSQDSQLKNCSKSVEEITHEKDSSHKQHKLSLQQLVSEVDELKAILHEKNEDLALLQATLGEKIDETALLVEKTAFETAAEWQRNLLQVQNDCQTRCSKAVALDEIQEKLRESASSFEASNLVNTELRESLDHCRLESGQLSDTSNRLSRLYDKCQSQATELAMQFKINIEDTEESSRKQVEAIATELLVCQEALNEAEGLCKQSLSTSQREYQKEIESVKKSSEQKILALKASAQVDSDKHLDVAAEAIEKANRQVSECRRDLDRLSVAAQGLSKFQIIVDERAAEVQHSVSAELEIIKSELVRKDKQVKHLTQQIEVDSLDSENLLKDLEISCSQKLFWLENSNAVKLQSLEESRDSVLLGLKQCSEERSDAKSEIARLSSVVTEMSEENRLLDTKYEQKEKEVTEMRSQLSQKEELIKSLRSAAVQQNDEMERKCQIAIRAIKEEKDMEIHAERESCTEKFSECPHSSTLMRNKSENYGIKAVAEYSMTQKLWSLFGHDSAVYGEHHLEAAIEHRTIVWERKFQDLEDKSRTLLLQTEEALQICYSYGDEKLKNVTIELGEICQKRLDEQEIRYESEALERRRLGDELEKVNGEMNQCSKSVGQLQVDKNHMNEIMIGLRTHHAELLKEADMLDDYLLETQKELTQKKMDAEYWREVYEQRSYLNISHIQEDAQFAIKEAQKILVSILESAKESARSAISFLIELSHRAQAATGSIVGLFIQVYDGHVKYHVKPIVDAGQARYNRVVAPLFEEINTKSKALFMEIHLTVNSLFDRFVFQFSRSCPPILSLVDNLGKRTKFRLLREGQKNLESLCLDAKGTSVFILELLGVVLGFVFAFVLRRHLLVLSLGVIRLLLWPIQVLGSMVLSPFAFLCRFPMKLLRLFPRSAREFETEQVDSCGEQSDELTEGDKVGRQ